MGSGALPAALDMLGPSAMAKMRGAKPADDGQLRLAHLDWFELRGGRQPILPAASQRLVAHDDWFEPGGAQAAAMAMEPDGDGVSAQASGGTVSIQNAEPVYEGGVLSFTVQHDGDEFNGFSVDFHTVDGSATGGTLGDPDIEYISTSGTRTWLDGSEGQSRTINVETVQDTRDEPNETLSVVLSNLQNFEGDEGNVTLGNSVATGTILDDDVTVNIQSGVTVSEGDGVAELTVTISKPVPNPVWVTYSTVNGTAVAGQDYVATSGTLIFPAESTAPQTITVQIIDDSIPEPTESFQVVLGSVLTGNGEINNDTATVTIIDNDENTPPVAENDEYYTGKGVTLVIAAPGVLANDHDDDLQPLTAIKVSDPSNGQLTFNSNGSFTYEPESMFVGVDTFTYKANDGIDDSNVATVTIHVEGIDLAIWHSQNGGMVPEVLEAGDTNDIGRGAFTVANLNDTDGDGRADFLDDEVKPYSTNITAGGTVGSDVLTVADLTGFSLGDVVTLVASDFLSRERRIIGGIDSQASQVILDDTLSIDVTNGQMLHAGREEVDLMRIEISRPEPALPDTSVTLTVVSGNIALWDSPIKGNQITLTNNSVSIPIAEFDEGPITYWVEAREASLAMRDIEIRASYQGTSDSVNATAVWATLTGMRHDNGDPVWPDATPATLAFVAFDDFGLLPLMGDAAINVIGFEYTVGPPGIENETLVHFDIARQIERNIWEKRVGDTNWRTASVTFPLPVEHVNDDGSQLDESAAPDENLHMYSSDTPGVVFHPDAVEIVYRLNALEWVRVGIGADPQGNGVSGSQASLKQPWHARHHWIKNDGTWERTTGDKEETEANDIGPLHVDIGGGAEP